MIREEASRPRRIYASQPIAEPGVPGPVVPLASGAAAPQRSRRPSRPPSRGAVSGKPVLVPRLDGIVLLLVEDDADARETTRMLLEHHGASVVTAKSGREGLRRLQMIHPDAIVCDILMPGMDGFEFVRALRASPRWVDLPVIALTALGNDRDYFDTWAAGFQAHLAKPADDAVLAAIILRVLGQPRRR
jgi:CheY-like chemotaxis protein